MTACLPHAMDTKDEEKPKCAVQLARISSAQGSHLEGPGRDFMLEIRYRADDVGMLQISGHILLNVDPCRAMHGLVHDDLYQAACVSVLWRSIVCGPSHLYMI